MQIPTTGDQPSVASHISLTIAIPTYNRPRQLKRTLDVIVPQVLADPHTCLMLLDNHSDVPAMQILERVLAEHSAQKTERLCVIRHDTNIGGNANIMRCFELCKTAWLWTLGDDDIPMANAVETILREMDDSCCAIFHYVPAIRQPDIPGGKTYDGETFEALLERYDGQFAQLLFLSSAVFCMTTLRTHALIGYLCMNAGAPHLSMVIAALRAGATWRLSSAVIADWSPPEEGQHGNMLTIMFAMSALFCFPAAPAEIKTFRKVAQYGFLNSPKRVLYTLMVVYRGTACNKEIFYLYRCLQAIYCPFFLENPELWIRWHLTILNLVFPSAFKRRFVRRKRGKQILVANLDRQ